MSKKESRRIVPASIIAMVVFALLAVFEVLVLTNAIEVKASTVSKFAPWAYEPFLKLVGELPGSAPHPAAAQETGKKKSSALNLMTGLSPDALTLDVETNAVPATNAIPDTNEVPQETHTNAPPQKPKEIVPVG